MSDIEKIYYNFEQLGDIKDSKGKIEADSETFDFLKKLGISNKSEKCDLYFEIEGLIGKLEMECEKQGFIQGFGYAVRLFACGKEVSVNA